MNKDWVLVALMVNIASESGWQDLSEGVTHCVHWSPPQDDSTSCHKAIYDGSRLVFVLYHSSHTDVAYVK